MDLSGIKEKFGQISSQKENKWIGKLAEMIRIDSQTGNEAALARYLKSELNLLGIEAETIEIPNDIEPDRIRPEWMFRNRPNLAARLKGESGGRSLILSCHMDTQPIYPRECWLHDPLGGEIEEGKIYGRGSVDNKSGVAEVLYLLDCMKEIGLKTGGDLIIEFVVEDETTGLGTLACHEKGYSADGALIVDGTNLDNAFYAHPGQLSFEIVIPGTPATSASAFRALNPYFVGSKIIDAMKEFEDALRTGDHGVFNTTKQPVNFNFIYGECGHTWAAVPNRALLYGNISFCEPWTVEGIRGKIGEIVDNAARASGARSDMMPRLRFMGYASDVTVSDIGSDLAGILVKSALDIEDINVRVLPMRGSADLRHFIEMTSGNCLLYGPGAGFGVHVNDEHFVLSEMKKCVNILFGVVTGWCGVA